MPKVHLDAQVRDDERVKDQQTANSATRESFFDFIPRIGDHVWFEEQGDFAIVKNVYYFPDHQNSPRKVPFEIEFYVFRAGLTALIESGHWEASTV